MRNKKLISFLPLLFVICYLLFACKSAPKTPEQILFESGMVPLDKGASAYVLVDMAHARPILEKISYIPTTDKNVKQMLDRTRSAVAAVFLHSSEETRRFQLVSWGSYPASGSSIAFGSNKAWKKQRSASLNLVYWHSEKSQLSIAVTPSQAYVLAAMTKDPHDPIPSAEGIKFPDGFDEFGKGAVLSCWLSDPSSIFNKKLREMGIPLEIPAEQFFVRLLPADDQVSASQPVSASQIYEAHVKITVPSAAQARALANVISFARAFIPSAPLDEDGAQSKIALLSAMLFTNPIVQEGGSLLIKTPASSVNEIALLFSIFSL
jgi:hypothetical protein